MNFQLENGKLYCWQWDIRQRLEILGLDQVETKVPFFLIGNAKSKEGLYKVEISREGEVDFINIPDEVLQKEGCADVYLYDEETGTTILAWRFSIKKKAKPMDYVYEETDFKTLVELNNRIDDIIDNKMPSLAEELKEYTLAEIEKAELDDIQLDTTLTMSGRAADSKAVGDAINSLDLVGKTTGHGAEVFNDYKNNVATGDYSHAEGENTRAIGIASHAEGVNTSAWGESSHAEGYETSIEEYGHYAHAEGCRTLANGIGSHVEGGETYTTESASYAHAEGYGTVATNYGQHVQGRWNIKDYDADYAHIVGNGTNDDNRSNAHTLDWDGNAWYAGAVEAETAKINGDARIKGWIKSRGFEDSAITRDLFVGGGKDPSGYWAHDCIAEVVDQTSGGVKNTAYISTMTAPRASSYAIFLEGGNNYIFKIEVTDVNGTRTLDVGRDIPAFSSGKQDRDFGYYGSFSVCYAAKSRVDISSKTFPDGYEGTGRINFQTKTTSTELKGIYPFIEFSTASAATVTIWWVAGDSGRFFSLRDWEIGGKARLGVSGTLELHGNVEASDSSFWMHHLHANGAGEFGGSLTVGSKAVIDGPISTDGSLTVGKQAIIGSSLDVGNDLRVSGQSDFGGTAYMNGNSIKDIGEIVVGGTANFENDVKIRPNTGRTDKVKVTDALNEALNWDFKNRLFIRQESLFNNTFNTVLNQIKTTSASVIALRSDEIASNYVYEYGDTPIVLDTSIMFLGDGRKPATITFKYIGNGSNGNVFQINNSTQPLQEGEQGITVRFKNVNVVMENAPVNAKFINSNSDKLTLKVDKCDFSGVKNINVYNALLVKVDNSTFNNTTSCLSGTTTDFIVANSVGSVYPGTAILTSGIRQDFGGLLSGINCKAGYGAIASGEGTIAHAAYQHVHGKYNILDFDRQYATIVGNGASDSRKNIYTLDWTGNGNYAGTVEAEGLILRSPGGRRFMLTVSDSGALGTEEISPVLPQLEVVDYWDISATSDDEVTAVLYKNPEVEGTYSLRISGTGAMKDFYSSQYDDSPIYASWYDYKDKINEFIVHDGVTNIGKYALASCDNLTSVELSDSITSIGSVAFYGCNNLTLTELPESVTDIGNGAFSDCTNLALTELPSGITKINNTAFYNCTNLALTELPESVTSIGNSAFYNCTKLALTELPDGITSIGSYTFYNCKNLALTELPESVTNIDNYAFQNCTSLTSITFNGTPNRVGSTTFKGCTNLLTINVPWSEGKVAGAPWGATNATINYNYGKEMITFTIGNTSHQAEAGMTWGQWIESSYNTIGAVPDGEHIMCRINGSYYGISYGVAGAKDHDCGKFPNTCMHWVKIEDVIDSTWDGYSWDMTNDL